MIKKLLFTLLVVVVLAGCAVEPTLKSEEGLTVEESVDVPRNYTGPYIEVFEHANYSGRSRVITSDQSNLWWTDYTMNDTITSIKVYNGAKVIIYEHADFRGESLVITADRDNLFWTHMNDKTTSILFF